MKMGAWPAMAPRPCALSQAVAVVIAETQNQAKDAAEAVVVDYEELQAVPISAPPSSRARRSCIGSTGNVIYDCDTAEAAVKAFSKAANVVTLELTNNRLVQTHGAARGDRGYNERKSTTRSITTFAEPARRAAGNCRRSTTSRPNTKLRVIAPDVGGGSVRRFTSIRKNGGAVGLQESAAPGEWPATATEASHRPPCRTISRSEMAFDKDNKILGLRVKTHANFGAYMSLFSSASRPISTQRCCRDNM